MYHDHARYTKTKIGWLADDHRPKPPSIAGLQEYATTLAITVFYEIFEKSQKVFGKEININICSIELK